MQNKEKRYYIKSSFLHNVLTSISALQTAEGKNSIRKCDLMRHMEQAHSLTGDVESQIESALNSAVLLNYVMKSHDRYSLIVPAARLHLFRKRRSSPNVCDCDSKRSRSSSPTKCKPRICDTKPDCETKDDEESTPEDCNCHDEGSLSFLKKFWPGVLRPKKKKSNCTNTAPARKSICKVTKPRQPCRNRKAKKRQPKSALDKFCESILKNKPRSCDVRNNKDHCSN